MHRKAPRPRWRSVLRSPVGPGSTVTCAVERAGLGRRSSAGNPPPRGFRPPRHRASCRPPRPAGPAGGRDALSSRRGCAVQRVRAGQRRRRGRSRRGSRHARGLPWPCIGLGRRGVGHRADHRAGAVHRAQIAGRVAPSLHCAADHAGRRGRPFGGGGVRQPARGPGPRHHRTPRRPSWCRPAPKRAEGGGRLRVAGAARACPPCAAGRRSSVFDRHVRHWRRRRRRRNWHRFPAGGAPGRRAGPGGHPPARRCARLRRDGPSSRAAYSASPMPCRRWNS